MKRWLDGKIFKSNLRGVPGTRLCALDVGGGSGWELIFIREADARIKFTQVVDIDPHVADLARGNGHEFFCGRIEDFCSDRKFDFILLLNLIEHVEDPYAVLSKIRNMLSPKGVVLVKTPNYDSLDARIFRHANWGGYHCPRHWVLFTKESFSQIATRAGLRVRQFTYTQGAPFWTTSILFWLAERGLISITKEKPAVYHPLFPVLAGVSAAFDFARKPFAKTSQMFFVLVRDDYYSGSQLNES